MDSDPCAEKALWSVLNATVPDLTLAGVLAGFLIAVVAALVVQWYDRASPRMIALFASGVPALMISSYLFTIESGANPPKEPKDPNALTHYCNQEWSQWLPAFAALLIGGSVLLCGLGWALVIYGDHLADRLKKEENLPAGTIEDYRRFFIRLSALLSLGATIGMAGLLITADIAYLAATTRPNNITDRNTTLAFFEYPRGVHWYAIFLVFLFGLCVVAWSAYVVVSRTTSFAWAEHVPSTQTKSSARRGAWANKWVTCVAREIGIVLVIAVLAFSAVWLTKRVLGTNSSGQPIFSGQPIKYVAAVAAVYGILRLAYCGLFYVSQYSRSTREDAIQQKYSSGRLRETSYNVVFFAVLGAAFTMVVTNASLWSSLGSWQTGLELFIGGLYPAGILLGLSYSVPADPSVQLPKWKTLPLLRLLP